MPKKTRVQLHPPMPSHLPRAHTVLATVLANAFEELGVDAALCVGSEWYPIHNLPERQVGAFELDFGVEEKRYAYNRRSFARMFRERRTVLGEHAGFCDLFVPVGDGTKAWGALAIGSFAKTRPKSGDVLSRWHDLTGKVGRLTDPAFGAYVAATLSTLTLEGRLLDAFVRLMECFSSLLSGHTDAEAVANEAAALRIELAQARVAERAWDAARGLLDERTAHTWSRIEHSNDLAFLKMSDVPEHALVGLLCNRDPNADPLDDRLCRNALQRESVAMARQLGDVVSGRVGDHGVSFLVGASSLSRAPTKLKDVAEHATALARRFGYRLHVGSSDPRAPGALATKYDSSLSAAEKALSVGARMLQASQGDGSDTQAVADLRKRLYRVAAEAPGALGPLFESYFETVAVHTSYRPELMRPHLEAGVERMLDGVAEGGALDPRSHRAIYQSLDRIASESITAHDLAIAYRGVLFDIELALRRPTEARQSRETRLATSFIRDHIGEPLSLEKVSRIAGVSANYFSKLFKRREGTTFEEYTRSLRLERAQHLLRGTELSIGRVAELSGFGTSSYFHRVFRGALGVTPVGFRRKEAAKSPRRRSGVSSEDIHKG